MTAQIQGQDQRVRFYCATMVAITAWASLALAIGGTFAVPGAALYAATLGGMLAILGAAMRHPVYAGIRERKTSSTD